MNSVKHMVRTLWLTALTRNVGHTKVGLAVLLAPNPNSSCKRNKLFTARGVVAWSTPSNAQDFFYKSGMAVDADGAFRAYHPDDRHGLDSLANAGHPGDWWALVTDNGKSTGNPVLQGKSDPAPGYYVSTTALNDIGYLNLCDPHRYVDALNIPLLFSIQGP